jgi:hypothetical protein
MSEYNPRSITDDKITRNICGRLNFIKRMTKLCNYVANELNNYIP